MENQVPKLAEAHVVELDEADARQVSEQAGLVQSLLARLGAEEERHLATQAELLRQLGEARHRHEATADFLARRYQIRGSYTLNAELGAFVGTQSKEAAT